MKLGSKIEYVRKLVKIERKEVSDGLRISQQAYANIENNKTEISEERLCQVARILDVEPALIRHIDPAAVIRQIKADSGLAATGQTDARNPESDHLLQELHKSNRQLMELLQKQLNLLGTK